MSPTCPTTPPAPTRTHGAGATRTFDVRHVQLGRALLAALAAVMVTFSPDHSASVGLAVFSGWAIATALVLLIGAWLAFPRERRSVPILLGVLTLLAGMATGIPGCVPRGCSSSSSSRGR